MSDHENLLAGDLSLADRRAVERAVDLHESEGALRCRVDATMVVWTVAHRLFLSNGTCVAASVEPLEGAVLVGWLLSSRHTSGVGAWWRRGARAVFLLRREGRRIMVVSDASTALDVGGAAVEDGYATQAHRFVVGRSDPPPAPRATPSQSPPNAWALPDLFDAIDDEEATLPGYQRDTTAPRCVS
jgi:hypothetical protein